MRRLYLLRHAKSSWKDPSVADHDRALSGRGRRAAMAIRHYLREHEVEPQLVLCSTARRARDTLAGIEPALGRRSVRVERDLYGASADELLARLRRLPDKVEFVLVIGHNPGIEDLARELAGNGDAIGAKYPTGALATIDLSVDSWDRLDYGAGELIDFVRPRDLESR